jgi:hypothetical protein
LTTKKSRSLRSEEGSPEEGTEDDASDEASQSGFAADDCRGVSIIVSVFSLLGDATTAMNDLCVSGERERELVLPTEETRELV